MRLNCPQLSKKKETFTALCVQFAIIELSAFEFSQIYFNFFIEKWDTYFLCCCRKHMQKIQKKRWKRRGLKEEKRNIWTRVKSLRFNLHQPIKRWKWTRGTLCKYLSIILYLYVQIHNSTIIFPENICDFCAM